jgi:phosphoadenosine phosphosulfate reductase
MRPSYLGKILLHWCDSCHVPVLAPRCSCGAPTREIPVTPPGDARPAFESDIELVNRIYEASFGAPLIPPGHIALLNKVPEVDRMEEIVCGGAVLGQIRYLSAKGAWEPIPRPEAAVFLKPVKKYVVVDDGAIRSIQEEGASVLAPGLVHIEESVREGDEVFIMSRQGECVGVGRAKVDASVAASMKKGSIVRTRKNVRSPAVPGPAGWDKAVEANRDVLDRSEAASVEFVRSVCERNPLPVNVSYSGGKDSLATLLVVQKAIGKVPLLFADTGLEFPETYENVRRVSELYGLEIVMASGEKEFWETFSRQGPPAVNFRWCCRVCKLTPVRRAIDEKWGECLSFIGQRKYESYKRLKSKRVWRNSHVRNQLSAAPIQNWTALHVWLYMFREEAPHNILYEYGLDRIGCFMCPSSDIAILEGIKERYPGLWDDWTAKLEDWRASRGLPAEWVQEAQWRMRSEGSDEEDSHY